MKLEQISLTKTQSGTRNNALREALVNAQEALEHVNTSVIAKDSLRRSHRNLRVYSRYSGSQDIVTPVKPPKAEIEVYIQRLESALFN